MVQWHPPEDGAACLLGRVVCLGAEDRHVAVAFADVEEAVWLPADALQAAASADRLRRDLLSLGNLSEKYGNWISSNT